MGLSRAMPIPPEKETKRRQCRSPLILRYGRPSPPSHPVGNLLWVTPNNPNRPKMTGAAERSRIVYVDVQSPAFCHHVLACSTEIGRQVVYQAAPAFEETVPRPAPPVPSTDPAPAPLPFRENPRRLTPDQRCSGSPRGPRRARREGSRNPRDRRLEVGRRDQAGIKQRDQTIGELLPQPRRDRVEDFTSQLFHIIMDVVMRGIDTTVSVLHIYLQLFT